MKILASFNGEAASEVTCSSQVIEIDTDENRSSVSRGRDGDHGEASADKPDEQQRGSSSNSAQISWKGRRCCDSESSSADVDLESGQETENNLHLAKAERDCRICHLSLDATNHESGMPIELGCSCKDDLAAAHKQCAETWFKIKGNITCEICGSIARNVTGADDQETAEQLSEADVAAGNANAERQSFWQSRQFLNCLLGCMSFAFVISWLLHFNIHFSLRDWYHT